MKKLVLLITLLMFSVTVFAADGMATRSFDVSKYTPNEVDFVKATISSMNIKGFKYLIIRLDTGWEVDSYEKGKLTGNYKKKHVIEILFDGKKITVNETSGSGGFRTSWIESLERLIINGLNMQYYIRQAEKN